MSFFETDKIGTSRERRQSKVVSGVVVWGADISSNRNQPAGIYAWIV